MRAQCFSVRVRRTVVCVALGMFKSAENWVAVSLCLRVVCGRFFVAGVFGGCS